MFNAVVRHARVCSTFARVCLTPTRVWQVLFDDVGWCTGKVITKLERDEWTVRFDDDDEDEIQYPLSRIWT